MDWATKIDSFVIFRLSIAHAKSIQSSRRHDIFDSPGSRDSLTYSHEMGTSQLCLTWILSALSLEPVWVVVFVSRINNLILSIYVHSLFTVICISKQPHNLPCKNIEIEKRQHLIESYWITNFDPTDLNLFKFTSLLPFNFHIWTM